MNRATRWLIAAVAVLTCTLHGGLSLAAETAAAPFPGKQSDWQGFARYDFEVHGKPVLVVTPEKPAAGRPWVWHGEFFGHKPAPDIALLKRGFHVVYLRVPDMLGCPDAVAEWNALYQELTEKYGLARKVSLVGLSRGGLYSYNWAEANPEKVACIYGDAPVCDFKSWPGGKGKGKGSPRDWKLVLERYKFKDDAEALAYTKNPVDNLAPLATHKVPLLHVYGDADDVVPWDENTGVIAERYRKLGGDITLIAKPGVGHHPHGLDDSTPIVEFIARHALPTGNDQSSTPAVLGYEVKLETAIKHDDGKFLWFHPRAAAYPAGGAGGPAVVMTIQKHLKVSDYYSGLHVMTRESLNAPWNGPVLPPELDWRPQPDGITISVADVTPGWHAPTGKLLAIGCQVRYSTKGKELDDVRRAHQTVYAVWDPPTGKWSTWQVLEMPDGDEFNFARNACSQWLVQKNGNLLLPLYIGRSAKDRYSTTVAECRFDGQKLTYLRNGNVLRLDVARGLYEPSLVGFGGRFLLTLRNDLRGYVSVSDDGLQFAEPQPWRFDDDAELGSYNTQQHWLAHSEGLFLVYTRRGANNDHIIRHRAPLFMAQVNPQALCVMRSTEKVVVPERGAELGNFGAAAISQSESWITVSEGLFMKDSRQRGAEGATFVARVIWSQPNQLVRTTAPATEK